jgi:predicted dehydrogenase
MGVVKVQTWLIGAGPMSRDYHKVIKSLGEPVKVLGRGDESAVAFEAATGHPVTSSLDLALRNGVAPERAIVAVSIDNLAQVASTLIRAGTKRILLEKPGAVNRAELVSLSALAEANNATVIIGYNRRYHTATLAAEAMIAQDGGATSCIFEFTEWPATITPLELAAEVKQHWVYSNSSHVIDLAFYLSGFPAELTTYQSGSLDWHRSASQFSGAGITNRGALFSYHANWAAPGRWGVEVMSSKRRYIFRPLEKLQITQSGSTAVEMVELDYSLDERFKPGLFLQTRAFLAGDDRRSCSVADQVKNLAVYGKIAGYSQ